MASPAPTDPSLRAIDDFRRMRVICIGAGMSGITVGCLFPQQIPNLQLTIYEKNSEVGGTCYPGLQPGMYLTPHTYQYTFASNPNWSRFYPPGREFEEYLKTVAKTYDVYKYTKFNHFFQTARWLSDIGQWEVTVLRLEDNTVIKDYAEVLIKATGLVNQWEWPDCPGRELFKGTMLHTANWDDSFDPTGKRVAVIGYGATGVQITPAIQPIVKSLDHYVRGKVWVPPGGGTNFQELVERGAKKNFDHPLEERRRFCNDPLAYLAFRKKQEMYTNQVQGVMFKGTEALDKFTEMIDLNMRETSKPKPELYEILKPSYSPGCRRLIMGQAWLECLTKENAHLIPKNVKRFTEHGIEDEDGVLREYDAIICATGFDKNMDNRDTPYIGQDGITLQEAWDPDPVAYLSVAPPKMPNMFLLFGPGSAPAAGSIIHVFEGAAGYIIKCIRKMQKEYLKSMVIRPNAMAGWIKHLDYHFGRTVLSESCASWFKRNKPEGRPVISWPGSAMHGYIAWDSPRFEDFEYESWLPSDDPMAYLGNGCTVAEVEGGDTTGYMSFTDVSTVLPVKDYLVDSAKL
ncbi:FAD/NAD(P)-binding domain-containing protein [Lepidopterella palustris CBS 459.81]|uniref:FAD/NAD(P)-binding domain-containing protein n=1 Tax=Lepidopterella palustris CBS 459.81 TaxID=1314670 RepID=A0A8E2DZ70_9PEZI|nr:FAD/NAD(P)-binding domain-containing protein [Lepidopterella palustris CBS 459.81]